jgi:two-component system response regulator RegA
MVSAEAIDSQCWQTQKYDILVEYVVMHTLLLVDDDDFFRERLERAFVRRGFTVYTAPGYDAAMEIIREKKPEMGVFDLKMQGKNGLDLLRDALDVHKAMRIVVLTGYGSIATATEAVKKGALNYLAKPADADDILKALSEASDLEIEVKDEDFSPPTLARAEWEHINRVLADCNNNISAAAQKLGLHRRTLQRKLYKYAPK